MSNFGAIAPFEALGLEAHRREQEPWGFDVAEVLAPAAIWSNPNDRTTPPNHAAWLVDHLPNGILVSSRNAFGHVTAEDADPARRALCTWLVDGGEPVTP